jgi:hypothetical protein
MHGEMRAGAAEGSTAHRHRIGGWGGHARVPVYARARVRFLVCMCAHGTHLLRGAVRGGAALADQLVRGRHAHGRGAREERGVAAAAMRARVPAGVALAVACAAGTAEREVRR